MPHPMRGRRSARRWPRRSRSPCRGAAPVAFALSRSRAGRVRLVEELHPRARHDHDLGRVAVAVLAVLAPLAGLQLARDEHQAALPDVVFQHVHDAFLETHHPVPFGALHDLAGVAVDVAFVGGDLDIGDPAAVVEAIDGGVGAEAADQLRVVQSEHIKSPMMYVSS